MDFIERIFGISPDNGSGTLQGSIVVAAVVIVAAKYYIITRGNVFPDVKITFTGVRRQPGAGGKSS
jgi:hypothetical protein